MSVIYSLLLSTIAGMSTMLGSLVIFFKIKNNFINKFITLCLSFSIAIMIGISITDLIPSSFFNLILNYKLSVTLFTTLLSFGFGILIIILTNKLFQKDNNSLYKLGILSMITLMIHNFPEGIATFMGSMQDIKLGIKLSISIMLHNIPEGISIAVPIYYSTKSKKKALLHTFLSGFAEPLGALLAFLFLKSYINEVMISIILIFVAGLMITLAIHEMYPKAMSYKCNKCIYIGLVLGIILIIINHTFM